MNWSRIGRWFTRRIVVGLVATGLVVGGTAVAASDGFGIDGGTGVDDATVNAVPTLLVGAGTQATSSSALSCSAVPQQGGDEVRVRALAHAVNGQVPSGATCTVNVQLVNDSGSDFRITGITPSDPQNLPALKNWTLTAIAPFPTLVPAHSQRTAQLSVAAKAGDKADLGTGLFTIAVHAQAQAAS